MRRSFIAYTFEIRSRTGKDYDPGETHHKEKNSFREVRGCVIMMYGCIKGGTKK